MKNYLLSICLLLTSSIFAQSNSTPIGKFKKGNFKLNKTIVTEDWSLAKFQTVIGKAQRERDGYNKTHTYDDIGIVLFEQKNEKKEPSGTISEFQIHFSVPEANEVTPKGNYNKNIKIDKLVVNSNLTPEKMKSTLKKWKVTESFMENAYRMQYKLTYIYFQFDKSETKLLKISIGKAKS